MSRGAEPSADIGRGASGTASEAQRTRRFPRPRTLPTLAALVAIVVCVAAGTWQQQRLHAKEALRSQLDAAAHVEPVALASLANDADWTAMRYRPVVATGQFIASRQILIDNKVHAGRVGYDVVTPLALADGRAVLVDRGWTAQGASRSQIPEAPPPTGVVSVHGRLAVPTAGYLELRREPPAGSVWQNLDPARFTAATGLEVLPVVVQATAAPVPDDGLVRDWPIPDFGVEVHRIYMVQWYAFAAVAALLWLWFHRPRSTPNGDG
jgi:surfeit locus 1 family protein